MASQDAFLLFLVLLFFLTFLAFFFFFFPHKDMGGSINGGTPKSFILIGFSHTNHAFWVTPIYGNPHTQNRDCSIAPEDSLEDESLEEPEPARGFLWVLKGEGIYIYILYIYIIYIYTCFTHLIKATCFFPSRRSSSWLTGPTSWSISSASDWNCSSLLFSASFPASPFSSAPCDPIQRPVDSHCWMESLPTTVGQN